MIRRSYLIGCLFLLALSACFVEHGAEYALLSPQGRLKIELTLDDEGRPWYELLKDGVPLLRKSELGFVLRDALPLDSDFSVVRVEHMQGDEEWTPCWGENSTVYNRYNGLNILLEQNDAQHRRLWIDFRAFDDGVALRYRFPAQQGMDSVIILRELTAFRWADDARVWWTPANYDSYESLYNETSLTKVFHANTPVTMAFYHRGFVSIHEAALTDYAGMTLKKAAHDSLALFCDLVPWPNGDKVRFAVPHATPWRTIQVADDAAGLINSSMILNLNEPSKITDASWIKPMKYMGIWWGMHLGIDTWYPGPRHGATTENMRQLIDFAAAHHIDGVLAEGWNTGWERWGEPGAFDQMTPAPDFDLTALVQYAHEKGVRWIGHHETGGDVSGYEEVMDSAMAQLHQLGVHALKTGYAGAIVPSRQYHHGQYMVNHYRRVVAMAARYQLMLDVHEPIKPTGIRRTWPNMMTREGVRGMEWNAWSEGNPTSHTTIIPFTRMLAGPVDYTPGIFDLQLKRFQAQRVRWNGQDKGNSRVHGTVSRQLALMVVLYSPMQMAADLPENYLDSPAMGFISDMPAQWDESIALDGFPGDFVVMARRQGQRWFIGAVTDDQARRIPVSTEFIHPGVDYLITQYAAGDVPEVVSITRDTLRAGESLNLTLKAHSGQALILEPIKKTKDTLYEKSND